MTDDLTDGLAMKAPRPRKARPAPPSFGAESKAQSAVKVLKENIKLEEKRKKELKKSLGLYTA